MTHSEAVNALEFLFAGQTPGATQTPGLTLSGVPRTLRIDLSAILHAAEPAEGRSSPSEATVDVDDADHVTPEGASYSGTTPWEEEQLTAPSSTSRKQAWTPEEDTQLLELVNQHGASNWSRIAVSLPSRIGKQCRERWHNHLSPEVKKEGFSAEEVCALCVPSSTNAAPLFCLESLPPTSVPSCSSMIPLVHRISG